MPPKLTMQELAQRLEYQDASMIRLQAEIDKLRAQWMMASVDVEKIRFSPKLVAAIVASCITIAGGMYASTAGLRSDVRNILSTMESQKQLDAVNQKLSEQKTEDLRRAVDVIDKRQQLQQIEIQDLKEMVLRQGVSK